MPANAIRSPNTGNDSSTASADVVIDGDRANAKVTYHFDKAPDTKTGVATTFVREDGSMEGLFHWL